MKLSSIATLAIDHQALEGNDDTDSDEIGTCSYMYTVK